MHRLARHLFTGLAALSLLLCVAGCVLWARSHFVAHLLYVRHYSAYPDCDLVHGWSLGISAGGMKAMHQIDHYATGDGGKLPPWKHSTSRPDYYPFWGTRSRIPGRTQAGLWQRAGFGFANNATGNPPSVTRGFILPLWFVALLLAILPALWFYRVRSTSRTQRRAQLGLCLTCGYDLRATLEQCPECGTEVRNQPS